MPSNRLVGLVNRSEAVYQNMSHSCTRFRYESRKSRHFLTLRSRNSSFHCNRSKVMQVIENCYSTCPGPWMDDVGMSTRVLIQYKCGPIITWDLAVGIKLSGKIRKELKLIIILWKYSFAVYVWSMDWIILSVKR